MSSNCQTWAWSALIPNNALITFLYREWDIVSDMSGGSLSWDVHRHGCTVIGSWHESPLFPSVTKHIFNPTNDWSLPCVCRTGLEVMTGCDCVSLSHCTVHTSLSSCMTVTPSAHTTLDQTIYWHNKFIYLCYMYYTFV